MSAPIPAVVPSVVMPTPAEPGTSTTEFWAAQITSAVVGVLLVLDLVGAYHTDNPTRTAIAGALSGVITLVQSAYAVSRGLRKAGTPG